MEGVSCEALGCKLLSKSFLCDSFVRFPFGEVLWLSKEATKSKGSTTFNLFHYYEFDTETFERVTSD